MHYKEFQSVCENIYSKKGQSGVMEYCDKSGKCKDSYCVPCATDTPSHVDNLDTCLVCGHEKKYFPTPVQQYQHVKNKYPDAVLLFAIGDLYWAFDQDAEIVAKHTEAPLFHQPNGYYKQTTDFPRYHLDQYLRRIVKAGYKVAICDQLEDPRKAGARNVNRGVTDTFN